MCFPAWPASSVERASEAQARSIRPCRGRAARPQPFEPSCHRNQLCRRKQPHLGRYPSSCNGILNNDVGGVGHWPLGRCFDCKTLCAQFDDVGPVHRYGRPGLQLGEYDHVCNEIATIDLGDQRKGGPRRENLFRVDQPRAFQRGRAPRAFPRAAAPPPEDERDGTSDRDGKQRDYHLTELRPSNPRSRRRTPHTTGTNIALTISRSGRDRSIARAIAGEAQ